MTSIHAKHQSSYRLNLQGLCSPVYNPYHSMPDFNCTQKLLLPHSSQFYNLFDAKKNRFDCLRTAIALLEVSGCQTLTLI